MANRKMIGALTTIWWARIDSLSAANFEAGLIAIDDWTADLTAGDVINFTDAIEAGYTLGATDSDRIESTSVGDEGNGETLGLRNYEANLTFFREDNPTVNTDSVYEKAYDEFRSGNVYGYWIKRIGQKKNVALAVGGLQRVSVFKVQSELKIGDLDNEKGGPIRLPVPFSAQGLHLPYIVPVATAP